LVGGARPPAARTRHHAQSPPETPSSFQPARYARAQYAPRAHGFEEALWQALRGNALGVAFNRQVPLGNRYIADFYAPSVRLVVEVDGGVHRGSGAADRHRDEWLQRHGGYRVVHVSAALVLRDLVAAAALVRCALAE
jgi:very-short-patch-repair endonuclease